MPTLLICSEAAISGIDHCIQPLALRQMGYDLIGPLPKGRGNTSHAIVAIDYFTKWVEAEPLAQELRPTPPNLSGRISFAGSKFPIHLYQRTVGSLTTEELEIYVKNWRLKSIFPSPITLRQMAKWKQ